MSKSGEIRFEKSFKDLQPVGFDFFFPSWESCRFGIALYFKSIEKLNFFNSVFFFFFSIFLKMLPFNYLTKRGGKKGKKKIKEKSNTSFCDEILRPRVSIENLNTGWWSKSIGGE